jgi:prepilin-type N-terminal cleavage/methylation domain-containing protein
MSTNRGFTLVELMVTISLLAAFIAFLVPYGKDMNKQIVLFNAQNQLVSAFYEARSMASAAYVSSGGSVACSYGVQIATSSVNIVEDIKGASSSCLLPNDVWSGDVFPNSNSNPYLVKTILLPSGVSLSGHNGLSALTFVPPDMYAYFQGSGSGDACITITGSTGSKLSVSVGRFGGITANNQSCEFLTNP